VTRPAAPPGGDGGRLAENIMHFARVLRRAGLDVGTVQVLDAVQAVEVCGLASRRDLYWTLHAVFVKSKADRAVFDQAFHIFWRKPAFLQQMMAMMLPEIAVPAQPRRRDPGEARVGEALFGGRDRPAGAARESEVVEVEASLTFSPREVLHRKDFEQMTAAELAEARRAIAEMRPVWAEVPTRRLAPAARGQRIDMRRTFRAGLRTGGEPLGLLRSQRTTREPPLVVLCDISGSMSVYSRMFLHFLHAVTSERHRVASFVFGTRLTPITRQIARRDVDEAFAAVGETVVDWSGGTRIGACLREFNYRWGRRVLGQGAHVLLVSDGLDRDDAGLLEREIDRLHRSCRRLVWLNPLLRYDRFEPRAAGVRIILRHVDEFRPVHNLASLADLARALSAPATGYRPAPAAA